MKLYILSFISLIILFHPISPVRADTIDLPVSATVGYSITVFGYTSPQSKVNLTSNKIKVTATSDNKGYFQFNTVYLNSQNKEICLAAIDRHNRATSPVCVPSPDKQDASVGPIILPPSISLGKGIIFTNETVQAAGESVPLSEVKISLFNNKPSLISKTYAFTLPQYTVKTDKNGYYSFNVPSGYSDQFRVFAQTVFHNSPSPKSNTLNFEIKQNLIYLLIFIVLLLLSIVLYLFWKRRKKPSRALAIYHPLDKISVYSKIETP